MVDLVNGSFYESLGITDKSNFEGQAGPHLLPITVSRVMNRSQLDRLTPSKALQWTIQDLMIHNDILNWRRPCTGPCPIDRQSKSVIQATARSKKKLGLLLLRIDIQVQLDEKYVFYLQFIPFLTLTQCIHIFKQARLRSHNSGAHR